MKKIITIFTILLLFPITVDAEEIGIYCDVSALKNNIETECQIKASDLTYNVTNVTGEITVSDNLQIVSSSYDSNIWKTLDSTFSVKSINLISENKHNGSNFTIATFKIKAINKTDTTGEINFTNVEFGDENYIGHTIVDKKLDMELIYDRKNEDIKDNPNTRGNKIIIPTIIIIIILGYFGLKYEKEV